MRGFPRIKNKIPFFPKTIFLTKTGAQNNNFHLFFNYLSKCYGNRTSTSIMSCSTRGREKGSILSSQQLQIQYNLKLTTKLLSSRAVLHRPPCPAHQQVANHHQPPPLECCCIYCQAQFRRRGTRIRSITYYPY